MSSQVVIPAAKPTPEEQKELDNKEVINDIRIEEQWAMQAVKYAEVHMNLLKAMSAHKLRLSPFDCDLTFNNLFLFFISELIMKFI